uniref:Glycosyltransferase n=1 Tax=Ananas comosus var. bracteatus TaxID=296719 RepID=A0A6V7Q2A7_ANACO|nr:unnamed protein product [Ananas comosus var. bracteatus]
MSSSSVCRRAAHVALIPSAGMGHLAPFCRLAVALSDGGCDVSLLSAQPTVSAAESDRISALFASFPRIRPLLLHLPPLHPSEFPPSADPFYLRYEMIRRSAHLLAPIFESSSLPISAVVIDIALASAVLPVVTANLGLKSYILFTTSASMLALYTYFPTYLDAAEPGSPIGDIDIPGLWRVPRASVVPALHDADNLFTIQFVSNGRALPQADGIIVNTFDAFEPEALAALRAGKVTPSLPPVIAVGPLHPLGGSNSATPLQTQWLNEQPAGSVIYVSFGSRTAMSKAQIQQLRRGIEVSGVRFLWVVKGKAVDREDDSEVEQLVGGDDEQFLERVKGRGMVVKGWVEQERVLGHVSVGGFLSHCGWNSVAEAAVFGKPILAWPRAADQRVNAAVAVACGLGMWVREWSWEAEEGVVSGEEIGKCIKELMANEKLKASAVRVGEEAGRAIRARGSSHEGLQPLISSLNV